MKDDDRFMDYLFKYLLWSWEGSVDAIPAITPPQFMIAPDGNTPQSKIARLTADTQIVEISAGSLNPIYPAAPGKELLKKPVYNAVRVSRGHKEPSNDKLVNNPVRQALRANKLWRQIYASGGQEEYSQQILGYASEPQTQARAFVNFAHGIY
jgi:hypothetical protein